VVLSEISDVWLRYFNAHTHPLMKLLSHSLSILKRARIKVVHRRLSAAGIHCDDRACATTRWYG